MQNKPDIQDALQNLVLENFELLNSIMPKSQFAEEFGYLKALLDDNHKSRTTGGWKLLPDLHMTVYFMGREEAFTDEDIYHSFEDNEQVSLRIPAIVYVPQKLMAAVCFGDQKSLNRCPHITLLTNELAPKFSNNLLEQTCTRGNFKQAYDALR